MTSSGAAPAQERVAAETHLDVRATVTSPCTMRVGTLQFPQQFADTPAAANAQAELTVQCPALVPYQVTLDKGLFSHLGGNQRAVASGPSAIAYELYQDAGRSRIWGDQEFAASYPVGSAQTFLGTGTEAAITIYATLFFAGAPAGSYRDVVTITIQL